MHDCVSRTDQHWLLRTLVCVVACPKSNRRPYCSMSLIARRDTMLLVQVLGQQREEREAGGKTNRVRGRERRREGERRKEKREK